MTKKLFRMIDELRCFTRVWIPVSVQQARAAADTWRRHWTSHYSLTARRLLDRERHNTLKLDENHDGGGRAGSSGITPCTLHAAVVRRWAVGRDGLAEY